MENKLVSIIIPVYNASEHIRLCLDSILNQTYKNIEIILVNDGSTDNSLKTIEQYKNKYPQIIKIVNKKNSGVADTRNKGLELVSGYYTMFSDNDDYMEPDYIETYLKNVEDNDIVIGGYLRKTYDGKILFKRKLKQGKISPYVQLASWGKLYKTSFIKKNKFIFLKTAIADDFYFNLFAYQATDKIKIIDNTGYHWMFNKDSLSNTDSKKMKRVDDLISTLNQIDQDIIPKDRQILEYFYLRTVIYYILFSCKKSKYSIILEGYNKLFDWLGQHTTKINHNPYIKITNHDGEQTTVKWIIYIFVLLQKTKLIKPFLWFYSKV